MKLALCLAVTMALPTAAHADPLTFAGAIERAMRDAPSLRARAASGDAARSSAISANRLPDPKLDIGIKDFPVTGPDAGRFNRDDFTMTTIGISQAFPNGAKRRARAGRAGADITAADAALVAERRTVRVATAIAWVDLHFAERRLAVLSQLDASLGDLQSTVAARLTSGSARPSQALEPEQLQAEVGDRRAALVAEIAKARAELSRWTGDPDPRAVGPPPQLALDPAALRLTVDALPSLRALDAATGQAEADIRLARADKRPDWEVGASYGRREPNFGDLVSVGVSIDLPLFAKKRQDPLIAARARDADRARFDREAAAREARAALDADLAEHAMHHDRFVRARGTLVPLAARRAALDRDSYAAGKVDLGSALLTTLAFAEAEVDLLDREAEVARDGIRINLTYGAEPQ